MAATARAAMRAASASRARLLRAGIAPVTLTLALPAIPLDTVSAAVNVWAPLVRRVAGKVPTPAVRVEFAGTVALGSVLLKCTVPLYPVTVAFPLSSAVTVKVKEEFARTEDGAVTAKCVAVGAVD